MSKNDGLLIQLNYGIYFYHRKEDFTAKTPRSNVKFENYWKTIIKFGHVKCHILFHWNIIEKCVKTDIKSKCKWNRCRATLTVSFALSGLLLLKFIFSVFYRFFFSWFSSNFHEKTQFFADWIEYVSSLIASIAIRKWLKKF